MDFELPPDDDPRRRSLRDWLGRHPSPAGREALHLLATTEAILLDHVYSAKALATLIADVRAGKYPPGSVLVFIHTGGVPAIFAEPGAVLPTGEVKR